MFPRDSQRGPQKALASSRLDDLVTQPDGGQPGREAVGGQHFGYRRPQSTGAMFFYRYDGAGTSSGQPNRIFTKLDDKLKIHSQATPSSAANDYFFNYFDLGLDVLFDSQRHTANQQERGALAIAREA